MTKEEYENLAFGDVIYYIAECPSKHTHYAEMAKVNHKKDNLVGFKTKTGESVCHYDSVYKDLETTLNKLHEYTKYGCKTEIQSCL